MSVECDGWDVGSLDDAWVGNLDTGLGIGQDLGY